jgi:hypothetical protein
VNSNRSLAYFSSPSISLIRGDLGCVGGSKLQDTHTHILHVHELFVGTVVSVAHKYDKSAN